ncbi:MAG: hypothetical protein WDZ59_15220 [Pirellulales bacterium]
MKLFHHWASATEAVDPQANPWGIPAVTCRAGSNVSRDDARRQAAERARQVAVAIGQSERPPRYAYGDRPLCEEIIEEYRDGQGQLTAAVTRNAYGALVLNTALVLFADIDYEDRPGEVLKNFFRRLLGRPVTTQDDEIIGRVEQLAHDSRDLGVRLYRTAGGYRVLVTSRTFQPVSKDAQDLLHRLGSDPLYIQLCQTQECFRARLSPKYFRCGITPPPARFPWEDPEDEADFRQWEKVYLEAARPYSTCTFIESFGPAYVHESVTPVMELHDRLSCSGGEVLA